MFLPPATSSSHHIVREKSAQLLQQLLALQLPSALLAVQTGVPQLLQHLAQLLVHLLRALAPPLQLCSQTLLVLGTLIQK